MGVRVFVRMSMLVGVGMDRAIGVLVLVGMDVRVDVGVQMFVLDLSRHDVFLLWMGKKGRLAGWGMLYQPRSQR